MVVAMRGSKHTIEQPMPSCVEYEVRTYNKGVEDNGELVQSCERRRDTLKGDPYS